MTLERGRRASSVDRALEGWRREAVEGRAKIAELQARITELETELAVHKRFAEFVAEFEARRMRAEQEEGNQP